MSKDNEIMSENVDRVVAYADGTYIGHTIDYKLAFGDGGACSLSASWLAQPVAPNSDRGVIGVAATAIGNCSNLSDNDIGFLAEVQDYFKQIFGDVEIKRSVDCDYVGKRIRDEFDKIAQKVIEFGMRKSNVGCVFA